MKRAVSILIVVLLIFAFSVALLVFVRTRDAQTVPQAEYNAIVAERNALQEQVERLQSQLDAQEQQSSVSIPTSLPPSSSGGQGGQATRPAAPTDDFDAEGIAAGLIVQQYSYAVSTKTFWAFLVVENTSAYTLIITGEINAFDASGSLVGAKSDKIYAVGPGQTTIFTYMLGEAFDTLEYKMFVSEDTMYMPVTQNLSYQNTSASKKEIVTVTNNGEITADYVEAHVLFFSNDVLVGHNSAYFVDGDHELKPGKSMSKELSCRNAYDSIIVVFTGRG